MTPFEHSRAVLTSGQTYGIWSLIVTFFGDMAQGPKDKVSGTTLTALGAPLEIKSQAMRVALHRLRKDGWINSEKSGRNSSYSLSDDGRSKSIAASSRIYAQSAPEYHGMRVLVTPPQTVVKDVSWHPLSHDVFVSFEKDPQYPENSILTHYEGPIPTWASNALIPRDIVNEYGDLYRRLTSASEADWSLCTPNEIAALRVLVVHGWRRLVLRHPDLPDCAFPADCHARECRQKVHELLGKLPKPNISTIDATEM